MIALAMLAAVVAYVGVWYLIARALPNWWARSVAVLAALAIPFWDLPYGYYNFKRYCAEEGGLRVYESISPQKAIFFATPSGYTAEAMFRRGFKVVEFQPLTKQVVISHRADPSGKVRSLELVSPTSLVMVSTSHDQTLPWGLTRHKTDVAARETGRTVARHTRFWWYGGWLQQSVAPVLGYGGTCFYGGSDPIVDLVLNGTK